MKCDCKKQLEQKVSEHIKESLPEGFTGFSASLEGYGLGINEETNSFTLRFTVPYTGHAMVTTKSGAQKKHRIKTFITASFCPFCGLKQEN